MGVRFQQVATSKPGGLLRLREAREAVSQVSRGLTGALRHLVCVGAALEGLTAPILMPVEYICW